MLAKTETLIIIPLKKRQRRVKRRRGAQGWGHMSIDGLDGQTDWPVSHRQTERSKGTGGEAVSIDSLGIQERREG